MAPARPGLASGANSRCGAPPRTSPPAHRPGRRPAPLVVGLPGSSQPTDKAIDAGSAVVASFTQSGDAVIAALHGGGPPPPDYEALIPGAESVLTIEVPFITRRLDGECESFITVMRSDLVKLGSLNSDVDLGFFRRPFRGEHRGCSSGRAGRWCVVLGGCGRSVGREERSQELLLQAGVEDRDAWPLGGQDVGVGPL